MTNLSHDRLMEVLTKKGWKAQIKISGKNRHLGYFKDIEAASSAYQVAAKAAFGQFANG